MQPEVAGVENSVVLRRNDEAAGIGGTMVRIHVCIPELVPAPVGIGVHLVYLAELLLRILKLHGPDCPLGGQHMDLFTDRPACRGNVVHMTAMVQV